MKFNNYCVSAMKTSGNIPDHLYHWKLELRNLIKDIGSPMAHEHELRHILMLLERLEESIDNTDSLARQAYLYAREAKDETV